MQKLTITLEYSNTQSLLDAIDSIKRSIQTKEIFSAATYGAGPNGEYNYRITPVPEDTLTLLPTEQNIQS